jgi:hypothetical protein
MINDRKPQRVAQAFIHRQPGMLMTKTEAGTQSVAPAGRIHVFIELIIHITFHALLLHPANWTSRFAARLQ